MDVMGLRRRLFMQMIGGGDVAQSKSGSFTGDGTFSVQLPIGFEPDVIVIDSGIDYSTPSQNGLLSVVIVRGVMTINYYHNSDTDIVGHNYNAQIKSDQDPFGGNVGAFRSYAIYSNGVLTITSKNSGNNQRFIDGVQYSWTVYEA